MRACPPSEALTPRSLRWGVVLGSPGPERRPALQEILDEWHKGRWVIEGRELGHGGSAAVFMSDTENRPTTRSEARSIRAWRFKP